MMKHLWLPHLSRSRLGRLVGGDSCVSGSWVRHGGCVGLSQPLKLGRVSFELGLRVCLFPTLFTHWLLECKCASPTTYASRISVIDGNRRFWLDSDILDFDCHVHHGYAPELLT